MNIRHSLLIVAAAIAGGATASAQSFIDLDTFSGGVVRHTTDITPDGTRIVGRLAAGGGYYWDWKSGNPPIPIGGTDVVAVSADGQTILGRIDDPQGIVSEVPAIYSVASGTWTVIPYPAGISPSTPPSSCESASPFDISNTGRYVTGLAWDGCASRAFRYDAQLHTSESLANLSTTNTGNRGTVCNDLGEVFGFGKSSRSPAKWDAAPATTGLLFDSNDSGEVLGISADGGTICGVRNGIAFYGDTLGNFVNLPVGAGTEANCLSVGAAAIYGTTNCGPLCYEAYFYSQSTGKLKLETLMAYYNITTGPLHIPTACSADGRIVVGSNVLAGAWLAELPPAPLAQIYGCGTNPAGSMSVISGTPAIGTVTVLGIDNPAGSQPAGSIPVLAIATLPDPNAPCGTPLPGFGMTGPAFTGELLINLNTVIQSKVGAPWAGAGSPSPINVKVPNDASLFGIQFFAQGALLAPLNVPEIAVTNAVLLSVGL